MKSRSGKEAVRKKKEAALGVGRTVFPKDYECATEAIDGINSEGIKKVCKEERYQTDLHNLGEEKCRVQTDLHMGKDHMDTTATNPIYSMLRK